MKVIARVLSVVVVVVAAYVGLGSVYKFEMYDAAMGFEAGLSELEENRVAISIGDISYYENQQKGKKPTVLLVHGFAAYKENWLRFARPFKENYHVIALDLPGHGKSIKGEELTYTITQQVAWINEFIEVLDIEKLHMAGNSMGGAITALYSATHPEKVITATLVDPAGLDDYRPILKDYLERGENPLIVNSHEDFIALMDFALEQQPFVPWPITEVSAHRASSLKALHEKLWKDFQSEKGDPFKLELEKIQAPMLIVWGKQDKVINYKNAEVFGQHIVNSKVHVWDEVGHAPMVEIPKESAAMMIEHIQSGKRMEIGKQ